MNIEELSKSQLLLLTILVNFVTSIATGILTVSLLDQAPPVVTQTVNRIVQETVQTIAQAPATITAPTPSPSSEELTTTALAGATARSVEIYDGETGTSTPAIAIGTYLPKSQIIITAALDALPKEALIAFASGAYVPASLAKAGDGVAIYGFGAKAALPAAPATALAPAGNLKIGETVLAFTADGTAVTGIVSKIGKQTISTTLGVIGAGPSAIDLAGNIVGIGSGASAGDLIATDRVTALLAATSSAATSTPVRP